MNQITMTPPNDSGVVPPIKQCRNSLGKIGDLEVRLAENSTEVLAAQSVRYNVFHQEFGARLPADCQGEKIDRDFYDNHCDHLIVIDNSLAGTSIDKIVGTYRLMRKQHAMSAGGYYSAGEFAVPSLITRHADRNFLELGRSCVLKPYRSKRTVELLWQGIWAYAQLHHVDVMMGCASFSGVVPVQHAQALSFLYHCAKAEGMWRTAPLPGRHIDMDLMPVEAINLKSAITSLPPLIKGYLRLGALFGDGAVIDHDFNVIDVMVILPVENISSRYISHYGENADRFAA